MRIEKKVTLPKLHNKFHIKVTDSKTGELVQEAFAENVVLDRLYTLVFNTTGRYYGINTMALGKGSGVPTVDRTSLFQTLGNFEFSAPSFGNTTLTPDLVTHEGRVVLTEAQLIGETITEVGLNYRTAYSGHYLITHAMLQDSEGNPISIGPKTDTQIIEIFATLYMERGIGMAPLNLDNQFVRWLFEQSTASVNFGSEQPLIPSSANTTIDLATFDPATKIKSSAVTRLSANNGNSFGYFNLSTCDIRGFKYSFMDEPILFPNSEIFPTFSFSERVIGTGDGNNKYFNFPNGFFIDGSEVVKVDGVAQTKDVDYITHQGARNVINFTDLGNPYGSKVEVTLWESNTDKEFVTELGVINPRASIAEREEVIGGSWMPQRSIFDLGQVVKVGGVMPIKSNAVYTHNYEWFYSVDGVTWTSLGSINMPNGTWGVLIEGLKGIEFRYLFFTGTYINNVYVYGMPSIEFLTTPANGLEVKASWDTGVPPKNANIFYDIQISVTFDW